MTMERILIIQLTHPTPHFCALGRNCNAHTSQMSHSSTPDCCSMTIIPITRCSSGGRPTDWSACKLITECGTNCVVSHTAVDSCSTCVRAGRFGDTSAVPYWGGEGKRENRGWGREMGEWARVCVNCQQQLVSPRRHVYCNVNRYQAQWYSRVHCHIVYCSHINASLSSNL